MAEDAFPLESLLREAFSARAAATREEWSLAFIGLDETVGELKRSEASGSFSTKGEDECGLFSSGRLDEDPDFVLQIESAQILSTENNVDQKMFSCYYSLLILN
jgi:hypothetical protein